MNVGRGVDRDVTRFTGQREKVNTIRQGRFGVGGGGATIRIGGYGWGGHAVTSCSR